MPPTRILLVQAEAPQRDLDHSHPLGLMSLAAYARGRVDAEVRIADMQLTRGRRSPVVDQARAWKPDLVGLSAMTVDFPEAAELAREIKEVAPGARVAVGGAHATHKPEAVLACPWVDFVAAGEGEVGFVALIEHLAGNRGLGEVPNLVYRQDGGIGRNPPAPYIRDLDSLPFPAWDAIDVEAYNRLVPPGFIYAHRRYASLMTSRGCPFGCAYCHNVHGRTYRYRSAENVVAEMLHLREAYRVGEFVILDDLFNLLPERVVRIAELILEHGLNVSLNLPTGLRGDLMTEEGLRLLKRAGMFRCLFAVDTTSERIQSMTGRKGDVQRTLRMIELADRLGILVHGTFIIGFPTETEAEARDTIRTALRSPLHTAAFHRAIPFHGTQLYELAERAGADLSAVDEDFDFNRDSGAVNASEMTNEVLIRLRREAYLRFYLSPGRLWRLLRLLPNKGRLVPRLALLWLRKVFPAAF